MATRMDPVRVCGVGRKHKDLSLLQYPSYIDFFVVVADVEVVKNSRFMQISQSNLSLK